MRLHHLLTLPIVLLIALCMPLSAQPSIVFLPLGSGFNSPVDIANTGVAGDDRLFIVEQDGRIRIMDTAGTVWPNPFLDITGPVNSFFNEQGLLGLAFHPEYASNGYFFVNYTRADDATVVSRFSVDAGNPDLADAGSEQILMVIPQPYTNHNGGCLRFGPDGYLYIGTGDGGLFGDPGNRSQDPQNLLGKMLRIDVDGSPYTIPPDNPFAGSVDTLPEIWQLGLRNPWRYAFDRETGDLWIADVGQNAWEEINFQPASSSGGENWGWRCYEGDVTFNTSGCDPMEAYDFPIYVYSHVTGGLSVTGGFVYRGELQHALRSYYVFADYVTGRWWTSSRDSCGSGDFTTLPQGVLLTDVSTFGEDVFGEMYAADLDDGRIYRIVEECSVNPIPPVTWMEGSSLLDVMTPDVGISYQWYSAGEFDSFCDASPVGIDDPTYTEGTGQASFWVEVTYADNCRILSDRLSIPTVVNAVESAQKELRVFPNPANDVLTVELPEAVQGQIRMLDLNGRSVLQLQSAGQQQLRIPVQELAPGLYTLEFRTEDSLRSISVAVSE